MRNENGSRYSGNVGMDGESSVTVIAVKILTSIELSRTISRPSTCLWRCLIAALQLGSNPTKSPPQ